MHVELKQRVLCSNELAVDAMHRRLHERFGCLLSAHGHVDLTLSDELDPVVVAYTVLYALQLARAPLFPVASLFVSRSFHYQCHIY